MLMALLLVLGAFSFFKLGVDLMPNTDFPMVMIRTFLPGASPEEVETEISKKIEEAVNTVSGIDELRSTSSEGVSRVMVRFILEKNGDVGAQEIRDKISAIQRSLPYGTDPPVISKIDPSSQPVIKIAVSGERNMLELTELARKQIKESLETVYGVGDIEVSGARARVVNVFIDKNKLEQFNLSIAAVKTAFATQNVEVPIGRITQVGLEYGLRALGRLYTMEDFNSLIISWVKNKPIVLSEIGYAENSEEEPRSLSRLNGKPAVSLVIRKQSGANTVAVVDAILAKVEDIKKGLPDDIKLEMIGDQSRFIRASIHEVEMHLVMGALLASVIVFLFMGNLRATVIAAVSIPTSLIATFSLMHFMGFTLNNITLLGLALAVGIVIDDAIVVLENIFRIMQEKRLSPAEAAVEGTNEIALAVSATTISLIVIFVPVAFMSGMVGRIFQSYGLTVAFAIGVSLFVAFTATPMLCSVLFKKHDKISHEGGGGDEELYINKVLNKGYGYLVNWSLDNKLAIIILAAFTIYMISPLLNYIGKDFMPVDDTSEIEVSVTTPPDWTLDRTDRIMAEIEEKVKKLRGVESILCTIGSSDSGSVTSGNLFVVIEDIKKRNYPIDDTVRSIRRMLSEYVELRCGVQVAAARMGVGGRNSKLNFSVTGTDLNMLDSATQKMKEELSKINGFIDVDTAMDNQKPEFRVSIDRKKMAELGISVADLVSSLKTLIGGEKISRFKEGDEQFDIILRLYEKDRNIPDLVKEIKLTNKAGKLIPIINFVKIDVGASPTRIERLNRERQYTINADLENNKPLNVAMQDVQKVYDSLKMPVGYRLNFAGQARIFAETLTNFITAFLLSVILMYIVLASQFESFLHPVTILLTLPLSIPFAIISLIMMGETLNIYSIFGLFMLFGIVKKNAILQIDYTNTLRERGMQLREAIVKANITRLRPILMTTLTLIAGMLPIALGKGPGAASRASMAKVIIGGQFLCLLLTLLVVPVAYYLFDRASVRLREKFGKPDEKTE
jgi:HAE1 family hydrophobic/amphiphilic exporter-1